MKLLVVISENNILGDNVEQMESLGDLNKEVAYQLRNLGFSTIKEVRDELKKYR